MDMGHFTNQNLSVAVVRCWYSVANYRSISLTPILSKVFERLVLILGVHLGRFMEGRGVLPTAQFAYRNGLGTCDALLCVAHTITFRDGAGG